MTSVMSFEQINKKSIFDSVSAPDDSLICPKAPTIRPMRFSSKDDSINMCRGIEALRASAMNEKENQTPQQVKKDKKKLPMMAFLRNKMQTNMHLIH